MQSIGLPILITLLIWWFATGLVLLINGLPKATFGSSMAVASLMGLAGLVGLYVLRDDVSTSGAYLGFLAAMAIWAWNEIGFLLGHITGPRRDPCPPEARGMRRFLLASQSIIYHELLILASGVAIAIISWDAPNQIGLQTFLVLWLMRLSSKFNIFLGVPNVTVHFLPPHLMYLASFFANKPMNLLFPFSITLATIVTAWLGWNAGAAEAGSFAQISSVLLATLMALAVLEHWFLVVPLPFGNLWNWSLGSRASKHSVVSTPTDEGGGVAPLPVSIQNHFIESSTKPGQRAELVMK